MKPSGSLTHAALCQLAVGWLRRPASKGGPGCQIAVSETRASGVAETPDAFGVRYGDTVIVEAKVSRSDFRADARKSFRAAGGMGLYRYYITPAGMLRAEELPPKWGLLEVASNGATRTVCGHVIARKAHFGSDSAPGLDIWQHERDVASELAFIARLLARVGDPEELNRQIKSAQHMAGMAARAAEKLRSENKRLREDLLLARMEGISSSEGMSN